MGVVQGLTGVGILFGGAIALVSAVTGVANGSMEGGVGIGLSTTGVIAIIVGAIILQTNE